MYGTGAFLQRTDVAAMQRLAAQRPVARVWLATLATRREDEHIRAYFYLEQVRTLHFARPLSPHGPLMCCRCGESTNCWCEACDWAYVSPPMAVCDTCDRDNFVCFTCCSTGATWQQAHDAVMERMQYPDSNTQVVIRTDAGKLSEQDVADLQASVAGQGAGDGRAGRRGRGGRR